MDLLITLGHNSSAIGISNDKILGYENERITRIKSDSSFPNAAINLIKKNNFIDDVYVSHWYNEFDLTKIRDKHLEYDKIKYYRNIITLTDEFTHHDAHMQSSKLFLVSNNGEPKDFNYLVIDGFGNNGEVLSLYHEDELIFRSYGYKNSLGLMYQFATKYCGMKENQDEYKFLGYEAEIKRLDICIEDKIQHYSDMLYYNIMTSTEKCKLKLIDVKEIQKARKFFYDIFDDVMKNIEYNDEFEKRVVVGYFIQSVIEKVVLRIIKSRYIKKLCVSGGVFYNVKLNNNILQEVDKLCIMPLAGDQGAALGLYYKYNPDFRLKDLCIGERYLWSSKHDAQSIAELIEKNYLVNLVTDNMEFGPRALCNTSTLALPTQDNCNLINKLNDRNEIMPMAPVILRRNLDKFFNQEEYSKIIGSDKYMIITYRYKQIDCIEQYLGVAHMHPSREFYTARPQVVDDENSLIYKIMDILDKKGIYMIINTSYNVHGKPIVHSLNDALQDHEFQRLRSTSEENRRNILIMGAKNVY